MRGGSPRQPVRRRRPTAEASTSRRRHRMPASAPCALEQPQRDRRRCPAAAVEHLQRDRRAVGRDHDHDTLGAALGEDAESLDHDRVGAPGPVDRPRVLAHRAHECARAAMQRERRALRRGADPMDRLREAGEAHRVHRRAAAVDRRSRRTARRRVARRPRGCAPGADARVEVAVGRQPFATQVSSIAACLPEQFIRMRAGSPPSRTISSRVALIARPGGRAAERVLAEAARVEDVAHDRDVPVGARVARRRQRQSLALERRSGRQAGERLQRLQAGAGKDRRSRVAECR